MDCSVLDRYALSGGIYVRTVNSNYHSQLWILQFSFREHILPHLRQHLRSGEKDILLGYCPSVHGCGGCWLFPLADVFEDKFSLWTGEWNVALDHCYRCLADTITRGKAKLRTREKWRDWIRNNERGQRRPVYLPTEEDFRTIMEGIVLAGLCPTWHTMPLEDITIPEQREG